MIVTCSTRIKHGCNLQTVFDISGSIYAEVMNYVQQIVLSLSLLLVDPEEGGKRMDKATEAKGNPNVIRRLKTIK